MIGSEALAHAALEAGVQFVTGYPGSPSTGTVEALLRLNQPEVRIEWAINEKSAFDAAFGASLAGQAALLCIKSVGLNVALDGLMVSYLAGGDGGFVILTGDDPGGWGSQNEEDSRPLVAAAEVPLLEPTSLADVRSVMHEAFSLSKQFRVPTVVRITRAVATDRTSPTPPPTLAPQRRPASFERLPQRFNVLPIHVVDYHRRLQATLETIQDRFEDSLLNASQGKGTLGIVVAGYVYHKLMEVLRKAPADPTESARILRLGTLHPLPERTVIGFLRDMEAVLVVEEIAPYVEIQIQAMAQRAGLTLPIYGRSSGHLPGVGELFAPQIVPALAALLPDWAWQPFEAAGRMMPSRESLCDDCPYTPLFEALLSVMERHGGRDSFVVTGETGCMVRAQLPPWQLLDVKYGMGSSIGLGAGLARAGIPQRIVSLSGDSAFLHSGLGELIDAVQADVRLLVVILANQTTALSGGQPHPAAAHDALGRPRRPVDMAALVEAAGVDLVRVVDPQDARATQAALEEGLKAPGVAVVIAERACPR